MSDATDQMPPHCYHVVWRTRPRTFWQWRRREPRDVYSTKVINSAGASWLVRQRYTDEALTATAARPQPDERCREASKALDTHILYALPLQTPAQVAAGRLGRPFGGGACCVMRWLERWRCARLFRLDYEIDRLSAALLREENALWGESRHWYAMQREYRTLLRKRQRVASKLMMVARVR